MTGPLTRPWLVFRGLGHATIALAGRGPRRPPTLSPYVRHWSQRAPTAMPAARRSFRSSTRRAGFEASRSSSRARSTCRAATSSTHSARLLEAEQPRLAIVFCGTNRMVGNDLAARGLDVPQLWIATTPMPFTRIGAPESPTHVWMS
jgi:hypothetical protein